MTFKDAEDRYARLDAMKVAKEQAHFREKAAEYAKLGQSVPVDLLQKYEKSMSIKLGRNRTSNKVPGLAPQNSNDIAERNAPPSPHLPPPARHSSTRESHSSQPEPHEAHAQTSGHSSASMPAASDSHKSGTDTNAADSNIFGPVPIGAPQSSLFGTATQPSEPNLFGHLPKPFEPNLFGAGAQPSENSIFTPFSTAPQANLFGKSQGAPDANIFGAVPKLPEANLFRPMPSFPATNSTASGSERNMFKGMVPDYIGQAKGRMQKPVWGQADPYGQQQAAFSHMRRGVPGGA